MKVILTDFTVGRARLDACMLLVLLLLLPGTRLSPGPFQFPYQQLIIRGHDPAPPAVPPPYLLTARVGALRACGPEIGTIA